MKFNRLGVNDADAALALFARYAKGYVVWDKSVRSSLIVAFTIAGVEDLVVSAELSSRPRRPKHGLKVVVDLRGISRGQSDFEIYSVGLPIITTRCSRDYYVVMGGHAGIRDAAGRRRLRHHAARLLHRPLRQPEASRGTRPVETLLAGQNPSSIVLGWHSYAKDTEGQHTTLTGNYGLKMEGLHNLPNVSFTSQIPLTPDFKFTNNHTREALDAQLQAEKKVYIAAVSRPIPWASAPGPSPAAARSPTAGRSSWAGCG
jgi:hypothetical protein